jgi:hypothetical protein
VLSTVVLDGRRIAVRGLAPLGQGGEAEVLDLGDGRALKLHKAPDHPDYAGLPAAQAAAAARLAALGDKLAAFPRNLPARVVAPTALATAGRRGPVVDYAMPRVSGDALAVAAEPRWRRDSGVDRNAVVAALRDLVATVAAVHAAGAVIGDLNDQGVLVDWAAARAWLIDADSFQYGRWPCTVFSERFVDPRLCDPAAPALALARPHDRDSDAFALAVLIVRCLLGVGPYGGVHQPADPARRLSPLARVRAGVTIFDRDVVYPRAATPWQVLPDELLAHLDAVFARGQRGPWPVLLLERVRWTRCTACGAQHARPTCPSCTAAVAAPVVVAHGAVRARRVERAALVPHTWPVGRAATAGAPPVWMAGGALWRQAAHGAEAIGQIVAGATHAWVGRRLGVGLWRAGGYQVAFTFRPDRRGLDERPVLPRLRGHLASVHAVVGDDRAWLVLRETTGGKDTMTVAAIDADGNVACVTAPADDAGWLAGAAGGCAVGGFLFVPSDEGIVRVEVVAGAPAATRRFPDTARFVAAGDELFAGPGGLDVRTSDGAVHLEL